VSFPFPDEESGVSFTRVTGVDVIDHFGDPDSEYRAAVEGVAIRYRGHRARWRFVGRQPVEMLEGVVTGRMPEPLGAVAPGCLGGLATYHTVLTPKGRIVSDLRLWRVDGDDGVELHADITHEASQSLAEYLSRILPPRLCKREDMTDTVGMISLCGPDAARLVSSTLMGLRVEADELAGLPEGGIRALDLADGDRILVIRGGDLSVPSFDVVADRPVLRGAWRQATEAGAIRVGRRTWTTLRVEAGRAAFAEELKDVIPVEAGIHDRAIDYGKGCYTGQEVIVRIRDRGRVNRHLRRLRLDIAAPIPARGTELFREEERSVGAITTAVDSPREGKLALAYVRREVEVGQTVNVGDPEGPRARVEALDAEG